MQDMMEHQNIKDINKIKKEAEYLLKRGLTWGQVLKHLLFILILSSCQTFNGVIGSTPVANETFASDTVTFYINETYLTVGGDNYEISRSYRMFTRSYYETEDFIIMYNGGELHLIGQNVYEVFLVNQSKHR